MKTVYLHKWRFYPCVILDFFDTVTSVVREWTHIFLRLQGDCHGKLEFLKTNGIRHKPLLLIGHLMPPTAISLCYRHIMFLSYPEFNWILAFILTRSVIQELQAESKIIFRAWNKHLLTHILEITTVMCFTIYSFLQFYQKFLLIFFPKKFHR